MGNFEINGKCEICDRETFYDGVGYGVNRCIFHCDKSDEGKWANPERDDVKKFWRAIREQVQLDIDNDDVWHKFDYYIFPVFEPVGTEEYPKDKKYLTIKQESCFYCENVGNIKLGFSRFVSFSGATFTYEAKFSNVTFEHGTYFSSTIFKGMADFFEARFQTWASFSDAKFLDNAFLFEMDCESLNFEWVEIYKKFHLGAISPIEVTFGGVVSSKDSFIVFENIKCSELIIYSVTNQVAGIKFVDVEIKESICFDDSSFNDTEFNGLNLESAEKIELKNTSFLGSHLTNVKWGEINEARFKIDRQMARQLKSINDAQGETVIANDFYALEMRLRSKELNWREHFGEKLVQNIHGLVSNHSNDWALPTIWFFVFGLLFATWARNIIPEPIILSVLMLIGGGVVLADKIPTKYYKGLAFGFLTVSVLLYSESFASAEYLAAFVNPLNFKDSKDLLGDTNLVLIYMCRLIEVFIGYQIITAIRKNTRRK